MGEIGLSDADFLYHYKWWQLQAIVRGFRKRNYEYLQLTRWQTWALLKGFCGLEAEKPQDLLTLPCDPQDERDAPPTDEEIKALIDECKEINKKATENKIE